MNCTLYDSTRTRSTCNYTCLQTLISDTDRSTNINTGILYFVPATSWWGYHLFSDCTALYFKTPIVFSTFISIISETSPIMVFDYLINYLAPTKFQNFNITRRATTSLYVLVFNFPRGPKTNIDPKGVSNSSNAK